MAPLLVRPAELATAPATAAVMPGQPESDSIADFLASAAERVSGLVIEGEPGIGKTTLWLAAIEQAASRGFRVESAPAGSAEVVLTFAVLADLFGDVESVVLDELPHVPAAGNPQPVSPPVLQQPVSPPVIQSPCSTGGHQTAPIIEAPPVVVPKIDGSNTNPEYPVLPKPPSGSGSGSGSGTDSGSGCGSGTYTPPDYGSLPGPSDTGGDPGGNLQCDPVLNPC